MSFFDFFIAISFFTVERCEDFFIVIAFGIYTQIIQQNVTQKIVALERYLNT